MRVAMLTTVDNPYNPFDEFNEWMMWDLRAGYNSPGLLARVVVTSEEISEASQQQAIEDAIDEITTLNVSGMHLKVVRELNLT